MNEFLGAYWPVIVVGLLIGLVVGFMMFRPPRRTAEPINGELPNE